MITHISGILLSYFGYSFEFLIFKVEHNCLFKVETKGTFSILYYMNFRTVNLIFFY